MGGLDAELEWAHVLSLGEQQRIAFLRLLLHAPALAFLDEVRRVSAACLARRMRAVCRSMCSCVCVLVGAVVTCRLAHSGYLAWRAAMHSRFLLPSQPGPAACLPHLQPATTQT